MRFFALIILLCGSLALASCGGGDSTGVATPSTTASAESSPKSDGETGEESPGEDAAKVPELPRISVPSGPPPKRLIVKDLKRGTGTVLEWGSELSARYVAIAYRTGKILENFWRRAPSEWNFSPGQVVPAWEKGLKGMRVGGVRKLIAPSRLAYKTGAEIWIVELLAASKVPG